MHKTSDHFDLTNKTAIVTGGAGLLGSVFAEALLEAGASVHLLDLNESALKIVKVKLAKYKNLFTYACDITDCHSIENIVANIAKISGIDVLINSAAVDPKFESESKDEVSNKGAFTTYSLANWERSLKVNLTGTFLVTQQVCKEFEKNNQGVIVNIASHYGIIGPDQRIYKKSDGSQDFYKPVDYSVTKAGMLGFTKALASYYRGTNIRVNTLSPGGALNKHDKLFVEQYSFNTILGRMANPDEYKGAILFLCSDASSYMTGSNLVVDGGWTAT